MSVTVPDGLAAGEYPLVVSGATTSTTVTIPIPVGADEPEVPTCHGLPATIIGSEGDDVLIGTDVILGGFWSRHGHLRARLRSRGMTRAY